MSQLRARLVQHLPTEEGILAEVALIEPNGDECIVTCHCKPDGSTAITGETPLIEYLNEKFGDRTMWELTRAATLGN